MGFANTLQHFLDGFVGAVLRDEFTGEGAGEACRAITLRRRKGGRELVHMPARPGQPLLKLVDQSKLSL